jgi:hypothetical protein
MHDAQLRKTMGPCDARAWSCILRAAPDTRRTSSMKGSVRPSATSVLCLARHQVARARSIADTLATLARRRRHRCSRAVAARGAAATVRLVTSRAVRQHQRSALRCGSEARGAAGDDIRGCPDGPGTDGPADAWAQPIVVACGTSAPPCLNGFTLRLNSCALSAPAWSRPPVSAQLVAGPSAPATSTAGLPSGYG